MRPAIPNVGSSRESGMTMPAAGTQIDSVANSPCARLCQTGHRVRITSSTKAWAFNDPTIQLV